MKISAIRNLGYNKKFSNFVKNTSLGAKNLGKAVAPYGVATIALYSVLVPSLNIHSSQKNIDEIKKEMFDEACSYASVDGPNINPEEVVDISDAVEFYEKNNRLNLFSLINKKAHSCKNWILYLTRNASNEGLELSAKERIQINEALDKDIKCPPNIRAIKNKPEKASISVPPNFLRNYYLKNKF